MFWQLFCEKPDSVIHKVMMFQLVQHIGRCAPLIGDSEFNGWL